MSNLWCMHQYKKAVATANQKYIKQRFADMEMMGQLRSNTQLLSRAAASSLLE